MNALHSFLRLVGEGVAYDFHRGGARRHTLVTLGAEFDEIGIVSSPRP